MRYLFLHGNMEYSNAGLQNYEEFEEFASNELWQFGGHNSHTIV